MIALSVLLLAGLAGVSHAAPTAAASPEGTFVPAVGFGREPAGTVRIASVWEMPEIVEFTPEEFSAWAVNGSQVLEPPTLATLEERGIIGADERKSMKGQSKDFPWSAIGRLYIPLPDNYYSWCSGTLVGPRLMAAARHCLNDKALRYSFSPGYNHKDVFPTAAVTKIITLTKNDADGNCDLQNDWALFVLDKPLGTQRGFFKIADYQSAGVADKNVLYSAGYPSDLDGGQSLYQTDFRTTSQSLKSRCPAGGPVTGDADTFGGMSGGPLWKLDGSTRTLLGTLFGSFLDGNGKATQSVHANGPQLVQGVNNLNAQNPN